MQDLLDIVNMKEVIQNSSIREVNNMYILIPVFLVMLAAIWQVYIKMKVM